MSNLIGSLGLGDIDTGTPDGPYKGVVSSSQIVTREKDGTEWVSHAINYRITDGKFKGEQAGEFFRIGKDPVREGPANQIVSMTPTMNENNKKWYKKRWEDLGFPEEAIGSLPVEALKDVPVEFGLKTKDGYQNISWVRKRNDVGAPVGTTAPQATPPVVPSSLPPQEQNAASQL